MKAYLETRDSIVRLESEHLTVRSGQTTGKAKGELLLEIPLLDLEEVIVDETVHMSTPALTALLKRQIPVHFLDFKGGLTGSWLPATRSEGETRLLQYQRTIDTCGFAFSTARSLIEAKLYNQRRMLQRLETNHSRGIKKILNRLSKKQAALHSVESLPQLLGCEGASTAEYFAAWQLFLPTEFPFVQRSTRPPANPVNACISYGASLVYYELITALHLKGLDPGLGVLHQSENGRWSLALDLMEPFRSCIVEALTLRLLNLGLFKNDDFESRNGGVFLSETGRWKYIREYETRMQRTFVSEHKGHRTTMRQVLRDEAAAFKQSIHSGKPEFKPFHMN